MLVKNLIDSKRDYIVLAVPKGDSHGVQKLKLTSKDAKLYGKQPLYYSQADNNSISGFKVLGEQLIAERIWSLNFGDQERVIDIRTQYTTASQAAEHSSILPTAYGMEGFLLYKYLDSNMFAVTTQNQENPSSLTVMLLNGVTGSIIH